jgi:hypothetical protein
MKTFLHAFIFATAFTLLVGVSAPEAAFDLRPQPPAERGAATRLAPAMAGEPENRKSREAAGGLRLQSAQIYGFRPFNLDDADFVGASVVLMLRQRLDLRMSYEMLSVLSYSEQTYLLSCIWKSGAFRLEPAMRLGTIGQGQAPLDRALLFDFALGARPVPEIGFFLSSRNPFALGLIQSRERCPTDMTAGLGYRIRRGLAFGVEIHKQGGFPTSVATGVEICLIKGFVMRTGLRTDPHEFSLGIGFQTGPVALDTSTSLHLDLGMTHEAGLTYRRD